MFRTQWCQLISLRTFGEKGCATWLANIERGLRYRHSIASQGLALSQVCQDEWDSQNVDVDGSQPSAQQQLLAQIGVLGAPNAGKSTLTNALVGQKVSAVSAKTNTTVRSRIGAFTQDTTQVILYDTPGVVGADRYRNRNHKELVQSAWKTAADCDLVLCVVDAARQLKMRDMRVVRLVSSLRGNEQSGLIHNKESSTHIQLPRLALVLNKTDAVARVDRARLLALADEFAELAPFREVFWVSALCGKGINELRGYLLSCASPRGWILEKDRATDARNEDIAKEIVREKIFSFLYHELPYALEISLVSYKTLFDGSIRVEFDIITPTNTVRKMVVGRCGAAVGVIGKAARLELEKLWKTRVHLFLNIKARRV